MQLMSGLLNWR